MKCIRALALLSCMAAWGGGGSSRPPFRAGDLAGKSAATVPVVRRNPIVALPEVTLLVGSNAYAYLRCGMRNWMMAIGFRQERCHCCVSPYQLTREAGMGDVPPGLMLSPGALPRVAEGHRAIPVKLSCCCVETATAACQVLQAWHTKVRVVVHRHSGR